MSLSTLLLTGAWNDLRLSCLGRAGGCLGFFHASKVMSITFICGKPGGGKGLYGMQLLIDEIVKGRRPVVTNLAIRLGPWVNAAGSPQAGFMAYLQRKYGQTFDVERRLFLITDEQCGEFFRYRPDLAKGVLVECPVTEKDKNGACVAYDTSAAVQLGGVVYLIDEGWKFWGAREWATNGKGALFYCAQHRKFGDDFLICTQNTKQIDTQMRMLAQDYHQIRNHGKERLGIFRQPGVFSVSIFAEPPTGASVPQARTVFRLDAAGIGGSYDTSAGVGLTGKAVADLGERKKGIHWAFIAAALVVLAVVCVKLPFLVGNVIAKGVTRGSAAGAYVGSNVVGNAEVVSNSPPAAPAVNRPRQLVPEEVLPVKSEAVPEVEGEKLTGLMRLPGGRFSVVTSKRAYAPGDSAVELITPEFVVIRGKVFRW